MAPDDDRATAKALAVKPDGDEGQDAEIIDLARQREARVEIGKLLALAREINPDDPMSVIDEWDRKARDMELAEEAMLEHGRALPARDEAKAKAAMQKPRATGARTKHAIAEKARNATAHHEAGHAVVALMLGIRFRHVTIESNATSLGHVRMRAWDKRSRPDVSMPPATRVRLERDILISLAGPEAERRFTGRRNHVGAGSDYEQAADKASYIAPSERSCIAYLKWLQVCADELVELHWDAISALALELLDRRRLLYLEVCAVVMPDSPPVD